jgi:hypothetical protein
MDNKHPLLQAIRPKYLVPPISALGKAINRGIEFNRHGIIASGLGRIGKSEALVLLSRTYDWRDWNMYWHSMLAGKPQQSTETYFFNSLKLSANLKIREQTQSIFSVHHMKNYLCEQAALAGADVIVLSIDDANRLLHEDYDHLVTLDNHVTAMGYRLFVILIMQSDADQSTVPTTDPDPHPSQITGRFTADSYVYLGLNGLIEIRSALKSFGAQMWQGRTFLEEFAPYAVSEGWSIEQQAEEFWDAATTLRAQNSLTPDEPFPMLCFDTASYYLMVRVAREKKMFKRFTSDELKVALELSGLVALERSRQPRTLG